MEIIKKNFFWKKLLSENKTKFLKTAIWIFLLIISTVFFEYFFFGYKIHSLKKNDQGIIHLEKTQIKTNDFIQNEKGFFVSQKENSLLEILTKEKYINNLEIETKENPNFPIKIKYTDPKTKEIVVLEKKLQHTLEKNKLNFLKTFNFNIQNSPKEIILLAENPQTVISKISIDNNYYFNFPRFLFIFSIAILIFIFFNIRKKIGSKPELGFLATALVCGGLIAITSTISYSSWDERIHYSKTDNKSFKWIIKKQVNDIYAKSTSIPFSHSIKEQKKINAFFDNNFKKKQIKNDLKDFSLLTFYNRIAYAPTGFVIFIARALQIPLHLIFIIGRIANVFIFSFVVFFAIKKLLSGKILMTIIALFPTSIFLASHYGYDHWVIAFSLLSMAYLFNQLQQPEKKITWKEIFVMIGSLIIACGPKAIYFPLFLLFFLLHPFKFNSKKDYRNFLLLNIFSTLLVLGSFMIPFLIFGPGNGDSRGGETVNSTEQVKFILSDPLAYSKILLNFLKDYLNPQNSIGFITSFAYLGHIPGFLIISLLILFSLLPTEKSTEKKSSGIILFLASLFVFLSTTILISTALYIAFTPVKHPYINGVQPRYLIPILFPLLFSIKILLENSKINFSFNKNFSNLIVFFLLNYTLLQGIWSLIIKNYY